MGDVISTEARAKYNQAQREGNHRIFYGLTFWSPNINIFRDPRWGRGQETYGEDPFLTARMGVAFVAGVQGDDPNHLRAVATSKHFAVHSGPEPLRHGFNVDVSPRDLEETYLPAFRATVTEGHVQSVMCAYNADRRLAGLHQHDAAQGAPARRLGLQGLRRLRLRRDRGREQRPQEDRRHRPTRPPSRSRPAPTSPAASGSPGFNTLADAVRQGLVSEALVTQAAERLYTARFQLGLFDPQGSSPLDEIPVSADASLDENRADRPQGRRRRASCCSRTTACCR